MRFYLKTFLVTRLCRKRNASKMVPRCGGSVASLPAGYVAATARMVVRCVIEGHWGL